MISWESLIVGSASTLNIWIDGGCGVGVLKMRKDLFVSGADVADCSLRVEALSDCLRADCFAFCKALDCGALFALRLLPPLGCLSFALGCSF